MRAIFGLVACLIPASALAQGYSSDAFGLVPSAAESTRAEWSGLRGNGWVEPEPADRVLIVLGPKSLVAGKDPAHAVVLAFDRFGNIVADGTRTEIRIEDQEISAATRAGIADHLFLPTPKARTIAVGATIANRQSAWATFRVIPDVGSLGPVLESLPEAVEPESYFEISSADIRERFGNLAEDGTAASVMMTHGTVGSSLGTAIVTEGQARALFLSRVVAGQTEARIVLGANTSAADGFTLERPTTALLPNLGIEDLSAIAAVRLTVGPFVTSLGYTLIDGAKVHLAVSAPAKQPATPRPRLRW